MAIQLCRYLTARPALAVGLPAGWASHIDERAFACGAWLGVLCCRCAHMLLHPRALRVLQPCSGTSSSGAQAVSGQWKVHHCAADERCWCWQQSIKCGHIGEARHSKWLLPIIPARAPAGASNLRHAQLNRDATGY